MSLRFAGWDAPFVHDEPGGRKVQQLLWGDWLELKGGRRDGWVEVRAREEDGWMREEDVQEERLLEIVFVDVGQGDGCLVVTPDDEHIVVDAGKDDSMHRFLYWRYGGFREPWSFDAGIITHPDQDHYQGFADLFAIPFVTFDTLYHNGIMERRGHRPLGEKTRVGRRAFLHELIRDEDELEAFLEHEPHWRHPGGDHWNKRFPSMIREGFVNGSFSRFRMLSDRSGHVPGWGPDAAVQLRVLGPVEEHVEDGRGMLRTLGGSTGKTKNGHSVVIKLTYGRVTVLLGGDLNIPSQELLLGHYTGLDPRPVTRDEHDALTAAARETFQVDVAKACHHGSADVSTRFLSAVNPIATVISSGDQESHAHPRADALGASGRHSRGNRPLILSTELARSSRNTIRRPEVLKARLKELKDLIRDTTDGNLRRSLEAEFNRLVDRLDRSVAVYGAIHLRTDGNQAILAQKLERPRGSGAKWDLYRLERPGNGPLRYISRYD